MRTRKPKPIGSYPKGMRPMIEKRREIAASRWMDAHARALNYVMNAAEKGLAVSANKMAKDLNIGWHSAERLLEKFEKQRDFSFKRTLANDKKKSRMPYGRFAAISEDAQKRILSFARNNLSLTPTEIAKKFGVSRQTVERIVIDKHKIRPSKSKLEKLRLEGARAALEAHIRRYPRQIYSLSWIARTFRVDKTTTAKRILAEVVNRLAKEGVEVKQVKTSSQNGVSKAINRKLRLPSGRPSVK
ncbi:MAG: MarR family transcriptional regulator [Candidatus Diapherotrites archaeon]|nr:MarR family transcriptional regulator [Candidatus Diapherotrites archaeon]